MLTVTSQRSQQARSFCASPPLRHTSHIGSTDIHKETGHLPRSPSSPFPPQLQLVGKCKCGTVGFEALGASSLNAVSHDAATRDATGLPFVSVVGFKPDQVGTRD